MAPHRIAPALALALVVSPGAATARGARPHPAAASRAPAAALPSAAQRIVSGYQQQRQRIMRQAEAQLAPQRARAARQLKALQDQLTRAARLDDALAVRAARRQLLGIRSDPGYLHASAKDIGRSMLYEVVGSSSGSVWGSQVYTTDSHLGTAAVHAGVLRPGEKGLVRVRIVEGQSSYSGSTANGVTSSSYGSWSLSFTVEPA